MTQIERRQNPRFHIELNTLVVQERCVEADRGLIRELSKSGALISMPWPVARGSRIRLIFTVPQILHEVRIPAKVVRLAESGFAVQFEEVDSHAQHALNELLGSCAPHCDARENTLPLRNLAPAANDLPEEEENCQEADSQSQSSWSLRGTLQKLLQRVG